MQRNSYKAVLYCLLVMAGLVPWLLVQMQLSLNTNQAWLSIAAERFLHGGHMATDFYDPNPPLSILLYVVPVLLAKMTSLPVYYMVYLVGIAALALSTAALAKLLRAWPEFQDDRLFVFLTGYVLAGTVLTGNYFAERDAFVVWGLFPFLVAQLCVTNDKLIGSAFARAVFIIGAICILIKPHYGLFPVLLLAHRMIVRRQLFNVLRDPDFLALAGVVIGYGLVIYTYFPDFVTVILPETMGVYIRLYNSNIFIVWAQYSAMVGLFLLLALFAEIGVSARNAVFLCFYASLLALCLFLLQAKGYYYHVLPALAFFGAGSGLLFISLIGRFTPRLTLASCIVVILMTGLAYKIMPLPQNFLTHRDFRSLKLTMLAKDCAPGCSMFIFNENMEMIWQASLYSGANQASRFPGLWWLPSVMANNDKRRRRYEDDVAADLRRWKPEILAIAINLEIGNVKNFDFVKFFSADAAFRNEMAHYSKIGQMHDNRRDYFRGSMLDNDYPITYDLYRRTH